MPTARSQAHSTAEFTAIAEVAPERFPRQDRGVVHPDPLQPIQHRDHCGFLFRFHANIDLLDNRVAIGLHLFDPPHHHRGIEWLNRLAKRGGIVLRQSFLRLGKRASREVGRLIHTGGHQQAMRHLRTLKTYLGRLHRDVGRKLESQPLDPLLRETSKEIMARIARLLAQKPADKRKLHALLPENIRAIPPANASQPKRRGRPPTKQPTEHQYGAAPAPYPQPI